eukprot:jgi/Picre1/30515/NNA_005878.t1
MKQGDPDAADKRLTETATELGNAFKKNTSPMKIALESLRAHYYLLYALNAQLSGRAGQLASGGSYPAFEQFFKSMEKIDKMKEECSHLDGLGICDLQPPLDNSVRVLGEMLQTSLLRISGRSGDAAVHLGQIEENLTSLADEVGLTNRDNSYGIHQQTIQKPVIQLQLLAYEYRCLASLVICDFQAAAKACLQAGALFKHTQNHFISMWGHFLSYWGNTFTVQRSMRQPCPYLKAEHLKQLSAYTPIEPFEIISAKLGRRPEDIVKLDANENPYGPPPEVLDALGSMKFPNIYPDPESRTLRKALSNWTGVPAENLLVGCGADELIDLLMRCVRRQMDCPPTFTMYNLMRQ